MTLPKIDDNGLTNALWRSRIDGGIDQINTNTTAIATNASNIASNDTDIATNASNISTNASNIASNLTKINADILSANTTITITQSGNQSTTQCVVSGHTSATFNASNYNNSAIQTIQAALDLIPSNQSGHQLTVLIGDETGQTIEISDQIRIRNFNGNTVTIKSAKESDNNTNSATKANKIQSEGTALDRLFNVYYNSSEVNIQGLELIQNTSGNTLGQFIVTAGQSWIDIAYCKFTGSGTVGNKYGVLSQRGANVYVRQSYFDNLRAAVITSNSGKIASEANQYTGTQPSYGAYAGNGIILLNGSQVSGSTADYLAIAGGVITDKNGVLLSQIATNTSNISTNTTNIASNLDKINADLLQASTTISVYAVNDVRVTGHHTVNYTSLQTAISALPKNMNGHSLTIQFQDGTYNFGTTQINLNNFTGGILSIQGNSNDTGSGTYSVIVQGQNSGGNGIFYIEKAQRYVVKNIEFQATGSGASNYLLMLVSSSGTVINCKFLKTGGTNARGVMVLNNSFSIVQDCNFSALDYAVYAQQNSNVSVVSCHDYGTKPIYGAFAVIGSIVKPMYTDIDSSVSNYGTSSGGLITHKSGVILEETILQADKTIDIPAGSTRAAVQAIIDEQPKDLNGHNLTFRFASGTTSSPEVYDFGADDLKFKGFHGGILTIRGVADESSTATGTAYKTKLRGTKDNWAGLLNIDDCRRVNVTGLQLDMYGTGTGQVGVRTQDSSVSVYNCRFTYSGTGTPNFTDLYVVGFDPLQSNGEISGCQFDKMSICVLGERSSHYFADNNVSFGTTPLRGYEATRGGIICPDGTVPNANTIYVSAEGGLITNKNGLILDETVLTVNKTVNFASSNSSQSDKDAADAVFTGSNMSDLQTIINDQPKNQNGFNLTFQFADGTYDFGTDQLSFTGFEGGTLIVKGSGTLNTAGGGLGVIIQSENTSNDGAFFFQKCSRVNVNTIRFEQNGSNNDTILLRFFYGTQGAVVDCSFANLNGTRRNRAVSYHEARGMVRDCRFNNFSTNISSIMGSRVLSKSNGTFSGSGNDQDASNNISSGEGSIATQSGTQAGGTASKSTGGVIFDTNGDIV